MVKLYGANWCPDCQRAKKFLGDHKIEYQWIDIEDDPQAADEVGRINRGYKIVPTLVFDDGTSLTEPTNSELSAKLNLNEGKTHNYHDLAIIGGGPTGLTTSIYAAREGIHTAVIEAKALGGQATVTDKIDNYPGFPEGIEGYELATNMAQQAQKFGVEIYSDTAADLIDHGQYKIIKTELGNEVIARAVLIACGSNYKKLNVPGEKELTGRGVHYCATCDGPFYKDKELIVVGGGNSAMQEGIFLTRFARKITLIAFLDQLSGSQILKDNLLSDKKLKIEYNLETKKIEKIGEKLSLTAVDRISNKQKEFEADGIFVFIGLTPNTLWLTNGGIEMDERGFIRTGQNFETTVRGVFAAGDCRLGSTAQIASAVGEGAAASIAIRNFLNQTNHPR